MEFCRAIRVGRHAGYVYIILLTSHDTRRRARRRHAAGADDFIAKPFDPAELLARIGTGERVLSLETRDVAIFAMAKLAESATRKPARIWSASAAIAGVLAQIWPAVEQFRDEITDGIRPPDLPHQPAARHRQSGNSRQRAAQAGPAERPRIRHHEDARHDRRRDAGRRPAASIPGPSSCKWPATSPPRITNASTAPAIPGNSSATTFPFAAGSSRWRMCMTCPTSNAFTKPPLPPTCLPNYPVRIRNALRSGSGGSLAQGEEKFLAIFVDTTAICSAGRDQSSFINSNSPRSANPARLSRRQRPGRSARELPAPGDSYVLTITLSTRSVPAWFPVRFCPGCERSRWTPFQPR